MTKKIQGTASRYARRKQRASTKARAAASERSRASPCQAGYSLRYTFFLKTSESESYSKKQGENFLIVQQKYVSIYFTR